MTANIAAGYYFFHFSFVLQKQFTSTKTNENSKYEKAKPGNIKRGVILYSCLFNVGLKGGMWNLFVPKNDATL